uniref:Putative glycosyltransferase n=1 Tax=viral metagenome TaxID=1070528 RepID=A0A6M3XS86_9ZZZZ
MKKNLIVTRADDGVRDYTEFTFPYLKKYAEKCDAEFIVITDTKDIHMHYRILQFYELFDDYDRILSLDSDTLVLKSCPDIFKLVPFSKVATIFEDKGSRQADRRERIKKASERFGKIAWYEGYINTGFALFSREHKFIFEPKEEKELYMDLGYDDVYLGYQIFKYGIGIHELSYRFNHMSMFSEDWNMNASRFDSYVIHYAGGVGFNPIIPRSEQIRQDTLLLRKYSLI